MKAFLIFMLEISRNKLDSNWKKLDCLSFYILIKVRQLFYTSRLNTPSNYLLLTFTESSAGQYNNSFGRY